jgi:hypothetical protein
MRSFSFSPSLSSFSSNDAQILFLYAQSVFLYQSCKIGSNYGEGFGWMGIQAIPFAGIQNHFTLFGTCLKGSQNKKHRHIIWLATTWCIWRKRNNIVFRGESMNISSLVEQIIYIAWFWYIGRGGNCSNVSFSDWCSSPLDCFR